MRPARVIRAPAWLGVAALLMAACGPASGEAVGAVVTLTATPNPSDAPSPSPSSTPSPSATPTPPLPLPPPSPDPPAPAPPPAPPDPTPSPSPTGTPGPRKVFEQSWSAFASVGGITLVHPSARVERVGFHESGHDGARQMTVMPTAVAPVTLETRDRGTGSRTAADIVVDPGIEIRSPVTGTVKRAGTYVLYCDYSDDYVVIEPDDHPGWEVKLLHIDGVRVRAGDRVETGVTVLAGRPTVLPFRSQVDDETAEPSWPHVHIEVVDPSIPNVPSGPGC